MAVMLLARPRNLIELLSATLQELEQCEELRDGDPAIHELRNSLVRAVAELLILRTGASVDSSGPSVLLPAAQESSLPISAAENCPVSLSDIPPTRNAA
jgi:hypothetical protein